MAVLGLASCTGDAGDTNRPPPVAIVQAAPDATFAASRMGVSAGARDSIVEATIELPSGRGSGFARSAVLGIDDVAVEVDYGTAALASAPVVVDNPRVAAAVPSQLVGAGFQPGNPLVILDTLRGVTSVESYGGNLVRGSAAFRYTTKVDLARALAATPAERRPPLQAALDSGATVLEVDVWIDPEGRVRRIQAGNDPRARTTTTDRRGLPFVTTIDLFDFESGPEAPR